MCLFFQCLCCCCFSFFFQITQRVKESFRAFAVEYTYVNRVPNEYTRFGPHVEIIFRRKNNKLHSLWLFFFVFLLFWITHYWLHLLIYRWVGMTCPYRPFNLSIYFPGMVIDLLHTILSRNSF